MTQIRFVCETCGRTVVFDPETAAPGMLGVMATCDCGTVYRLAAGVVTAVSAMDSRHQPWMRVRRDADHAWLEIGGDLDFGSRDALRDAVKEALAEPVAPRFTIDLSAVTFIDTMALRAIVLAIESARNAGIRPTVLASDIVRRVFEVSGLDHLIR